MQEMIASKDDVIAVRVSGTISGDNLDAIMDRLDAAFAAHQTVHVFVETDSIGGLELASLPSYIKRAMPLFAMLGRFGRVAVVADQAWIRAATKLESALLPNISYRTYEPADRDRALAWVTTGAE